MSWKAIQVIFLKGTVIIRQIFFSILLKRRREKNSRSKRQKDKDKVQKSRCFSRIKISQNKFLGTNIEKKLGRLSSLIILIIQSLRLLLLRIL